MTLLVLFAGCRAKPPPTYRDGWRIAAGGHAGYATIDADRGAEPDGYALGARIELFRSLSPVEFGARLSLGETDADSNETGFQIDADVTEVQLDAVLRYLWHPARSTLKPWMEMFVGGGYYDADVDIVGPGPSGTDDAVGLTLGGGVGTEVLLSDFTALVLGAELRYSRYDTDVLDASELNVLGTFMIGHRW